MKRILLAGAMFLLGAPSMLNAQARGDAPKTWVSAYGLMYTGMSDLRDPETQSRWLFDDNAFGLGASLQRQFGTSIMIGVDASYARPKYERRELDVDDIIAGGTATVGTAMLLGRYGYAGGSDIGFYLSGGVGTVAYRLEDLTGWNADFALQAGTGLEYRFDRNKAVALEWGRIWGYHEKEDLGGGRQNHSALKLVGRLGF